MPYHASVTAAPEFIAQLHRARARTHLQPTKPADMEFSGLLAGLRALCELLTHNPYSTRSVHFAEIPAPAVTQRIARLTERAKALQLPNLKEAGLGPYVVLFAHSEKRVVLLALLRQDDLVLNSREAL